MKNPMYGQNKFDEAAALEVSEPSNLKGLNITTIGTSGTVTYVYGIVINNFTGAAAQVATLPAALPGMVCIHYQSVDSTGGTNTCIFDCAGSDILATGSILESRGSSAVTFDTSATDETRVVFTPANATTNLVTIGSKFIFYCHDKGVWEVEGRFSSDPLAVTGAITFAA